MIHGNSCWNMDICFPGPEHGLDLGRRGQSLLEGAPCKATYRLPFCVFVCTKLKHSRIMSRSKLTTGLETKQVLSAGRTLQ